MIFGGVTLYYKRSLSLPVTRRLSREELRVFTACREAISLENLVAKTKLQQDQIISVINTFVSEGLMAKFGSLEDAHQTSFEKPSVVATSTTKVNNPTNELRQRIESFLVARLPSTKSQKFIEQFHTCSNESELKETTRVVAKKISLIVNASVGKELLSLIDY